MAKNKIQKAKFGTSNGPFEVKPAKIPHCERGKKIDLKQYIEFSRFRYILMKTFGTLLLAIGALLIDIYLLPKIFVVAKVPPEIGIYFSYALRSVVFVPMFAWYYYTVYFDTMELRVEGFRLVLGDGVLKRQYDSRPLVVINTILVDQDFMDKLFGIFELKFCFMTSSMAKRMKPYIKVVALTEAGAVELEKFLCDEIGRQIGRSDNTKALEARLANLFSPVIEEPEVPQDIEKPPAKG